MATVLPLPALSPTMEEGLLVSWQVELGQTIEVDDILAEVETDKAITDCPSYEEGTVLALLVEEGQSVKVGAPYLVLGEKGEDITALLASLPQEDKAAPAPASTPSTPPPRREHIKASPLARALAAQRGLELGQITGSGPKGRIIQRDVETAAEAKAPAATPPLSQTAPVPAPPPAQTSPSTEDRVLPHSAMRRTIARRLLESKRGAPHFYLQRKVQMDAALDFRREINTALEPQGLKVSVNDLLIKASALALRQVPEVNASWTDDAIIEHGRVHVSMAVAVEGGLITPVLRDADTLPLSRLSQLTKELAAKARDRRLQPQDYTGGTFSVSNLGMMGIERFTAVINPPEAAILAIGATQEEPTLLDGSLAIRRMLALTLSCDHRVVDGATGARFLQALAHAMEHPLSMVL